MHSGLPFLTAVDMPLFFLISGFFAPKSTKYSVSEALRRKSVGLLKLTFIYLAVFSALAPVLALIPGAGPQVASPFQWFTVQALFIDPLFYQPFQPFIAPLWFVPTLWWAMLLWIATRGMYEDFKAFPLAKKLQILAFLGIVFVAAVRSPNLDQSRAIGFVARTLYAYVFVCLGFILFLYKDDILYGRWRPILLALAALSLVFKAVFWNGLPPMDIRSMSFGHEARYYTILVSFSGIALVFVLAQVLNRFRMLGRFFRYAGEKSFHIMCLHSLGHVLFVHAPLSWAGLSIAKAGWPFSGLIFISAGLAFSLLVVALLDKAKTLLAPGTAAG